MSKTFSYILVFVIGVIITFFLQGKEEIIKVVETQKTDTLFIHKTDTIFIDKPKYITKRIVDTIYIESSKDTTPLPIEQIYYSEKDLYDLWISGYKTVLDSIKVYNKECEVVVTKEVTKKIYPQTYRLYIGGGFQTFSDTFIPQLNISLATPKKVLIGANLGLYNNKTVYGFTIQYRIFGK